MYLTNNTTLSQYEIVFATAAPLYPSLDLKTKTQHTTSWNNVVTMEVSIIG